jgi:hypothetical protein
MRCLKQAVFSISFLALSGLAVGGCAAVAGAGAGTAAGVAYSDRGAQGDAKGSLQDVSKRAEDVFKQMGIQPTETSTKNAEGKRELKGKQGDTDVTVQMKSTGKDTTHLEVIARQGTLKWNKDYAKNVLQQIVQKG